MGLKIFKDVRWLIYLLIILGVVGLLKWTFLPHNFFEQNQKVLAQINYIVLLVLSISITVLLLFIFAIFVSSRIKFLDNVKTPKFLYYFVGFCGICFILFLVVYLVFLPSANETFKFARTILIVTLSITIMHLITKGKNISM